MDSLGSVSSDEGDDEAVSAAPFGSTTDVGRVPFYLQRGATGKPASDRSIARLAADASGDAVALRETPTYAEEAERRSAADAPRRRRRRSCCRRRRRARAEPAVAPLLGEHQRRAGERARRAAAPPVRLDGAAPGRAAARSGGGPSPVSYAPPIFPDAALSRRADGSEGERAAEAATRLATKIYRLPSARRNALDSISDGGARSCTGSRAGSAASSSRVLAGSACSGSAVHFDNLGFGASAPPPLPPPRWSRPTTAASETSDGGPAQEAEEGSEFVAGTGASTTYGATVASSAANADDAPCAARPIICPRRPPARRRPHRPRRQPPRAVLDATRRGDARPRCVLGEAPPASPAYSLVAPSRRRSRRPRRRRRRGEAAASATRPAMRLGPKAFLGEQGGGRAAGESVLLAAERRGKAVKQARLEVAAEAAAAEVWRRRPPSPPPLAAAPRHRAADAGPSVADGGGWLRASFARRRRVQVIPLRAGRHRECEHAAAAAAAARRRRRRRARGG